MQLRPLSGVTRWAGRDRRAADAKGETIREARDGRAQAAQRSAGDLDPLDAFYDAYAARAYSLALRVLGGDGVTAEGIVVEAFVAVWQSQAAAEEGETAALELVLLHQVRERSIGVLNSRQDTVCRPSTGAFSPDPTTFGTRTGATPTSAAIREQLAALSLDQREFIERAFYQGQRSQWIAEEGGISKDSVHRAMRSGLRTLVDRLSYVENSVTRADPSGGSKRTSH